MSLLEVVKELAPKQLENEPDPDFDWLPTLFAVTGEELLVAGFDPKFLDDKPLWRAYLAKFIGNSGATELVLLTSAWVVEIHREEDESVEEFKERGLGSPPSESPNRKEVLALTYVSADGAETTAFADIQRDRKSPVKLGEWEEFPAQLAGPTIDALRVGLR